MSDVCEKCLGTLRRMLVDGVAVNECACLNAQVVVKQVIENDNPVGVIVKKITKKDK